MLPVAYIKTDKDTALSIAFEKCITEANSTESDRPDLSKKPMRVMYTKKNLKNFLMDKSRWDSEEVTREDVIDTFLRVLDKYYYTDKSLHHKQKLLLNLKLKVTKLEVYCLVFEWYNKLEDYNLDQV